MTKKERDELRQWAEDCIMEDTGGIWPEHVLSVLDALDEAERCREIDLGIIEEMGKRIGELEQVDDTQKSR